jgi:hypothetical protein
MKNNATKVLISITLSAVFAASTFAQGPAARLRFAAGGKTASNSGTLQREAMKDFFVAGKKGQKMTISVSSPCKAHVLMEVTPADSIELAQQSQFFSEKLGKTGDLKVRVFSTSPDTCRYTLKVSVK